jgi:hypothetical protein
MRSAAIAALRPQSEVPYEARSQDLRFKTWDAAACAFLKAAFTWGTRSNRLRAIAAEMERLSDDA